MWTVEISNQYHFVSVFKPGQPRITLGTVALKPDGSPIGPAGKQRLEFAAKIAAALNEFDINHTTTQEATK